MEKIMFNDRYGLNQAVLDRRKTNTRRIVPERLFQECRSNAWIEAGGFNAKWKEKALALMLKSSPYKVGDVVAVAQSYSTMRVTDTLAVQEETGERFLLEKFKRSKGWSNKLFVAAKYMPHRIRITNVRLERLQDISDEDCLNEGVNKICDFYGFPDIAKDDWGHYDTPRNAFAALIDAICGRGTWYSNPYVFVYDFELIR